MSDELSEWIAQHQCTYDIQPIVELAAGEVAQMGFELNLHAELPLRGPLTPEDGKKLDEIRDKLGEILKLLLPEASKARFELVPFRRAVRFTTGGKNPKVTRTVRVFPHDYQKVQPGDREKFGPTENRLAEMGFRRA